MEEFATGEQNHAALQFARPLTDEELVTLAELRYYHRQYIKALEELAHSMGIEFQQYSALLMIAGSTLQNGPVIITKLAKLLGLELHSTVELVTRMEARGLVHREQDKVDLRRRYVYLSEEGKRLVRTATVSHFALARERIPPFVEAAQHFLAQVQGEGDAEE